MEDPNVSMKAKDYMVKVLLINGRSQRIVESKDYLVKVPLNNGKSQRIGESKRLSGQSPFHQWKIPK